MPSALRICDVQAIFLFDLHKHPTDVTWEKSLVGNIFRRGEEGGLDGAPLDGGATRCSNEEIFQKF